MIGTVKAGRREHNLQMVIIRTLNWIIFLGKSLELVLEIKEVIFEISDA